MNILRVNVAEGTTRLESLGAGRRHYGGRLLTSWTVANEVPPLCHPLGPHNKLILACGLFAGWPACPCSGRLSAGCKSPLTGTIKEANAGGDAGTNLGRLGLRSIVLEGLPPGDTWRVLHLSADGARLDDAAGLVGLNNYDLVERARGKYGQKASIVSIGRAGEQRLGAASIAVTSAEGAPSRHCGRGGVGAVMGAKQIKAVVIDEAAGNGMEPADPAAFRERCAEWARELRSAREVLREYGTANLVLPINEVGGLATRNFSDGRFEGAERISGERMRELMDERGGAHGQRCMAGCPIQCANRYHSADGTVTDDVEFESIVLLGSNCGIDDFDGLARLERMCDDIGLDTIEVGGALGVAMEGGVLPFGDVAGAAALLRQVTEGTMAGKLIASGAATVARVLGVRRVPASKGQGLSAYDPRGLKGMGVAYATSPMGADHTAGPAIPNRPGLTPLELDPVLAQDKDKLSFDLQVMTGALDLLGVCMFTGPVIAGMGKWAGILSAMLGEEWTPQQLMEEAERMLALEHDFNRRAGFSEVDDRLPEHFSEEPLPPTGSVFDVPGEALDRVTSGYTVAERLADRPAEA